MDPDHRPSLANLPHKLRQNIAEWPVKLRQWRSELREDPTLFWRTPLVRVGLWVSLGIVAIVVASWLTSALTPRGGGEFREPTPMATLYVACTNPDCRATNTVELPMDFGDWPLKCDKCGQESVYRAHLCPTCKHWFATAPGEPPECPFCAAKRAAAQPVEPAPTGPVNADDEEDPWE